MGTDSHTTMINGLGVLGYGVGGIEAEAVLLGQPLYQPMPRIVGVRLSGELPPSATATDLVLVITEMLRKFGVVGSFVEFAGDGLAGLPLADRATISNMSPEFGATSTLFPIDAETLAYLRLTGRPAERVDLVERYAKAQGLWREPGEGPVFDARLELDLGTVEPSLAGPRRPQDRVALSGVGDNFRAAYPATVGVPRKTIEAGGRATEIGHGSVTIAAITSCTNTSNPMVMVGAGLLARNAVARGLRVNPAVKTSLAPGSRAVTGYLERAGLMEPLADLGFALAGYGCTTCIGNSGPLDEPIARAIEDDALVVAAVLSGNRNFEGRVHPLVRAAYLASPPLVVAFALAGRVDVDLTTEPLGIGADGTPVMLADVWPTPAQVRDVVGATIDAELFRATYATVFEGDERWRAIAIPEGDRYAWDDDSTYIANPPFFQGLAKEPTPLTDIVGARVLALLGDSVTTDHISPAGSIAASSPAGQWLQARGVAPVDFNQYGARRGHHEVMMRGTFGNIRLKNGLVEGKEGPYTVHLPDGAETFIYDAAMAYRAAGTPCLVIAGKEYGSGSSRDWAAKGTSAARDPGGHRGELRADPSLQPRRHGRAAAPVPAGRQRDVARPDRPRGVHHRRHGGPRPATGRHDRGALRRRRHRADVPGDRAARRPDRGGLPAPGRHPAGGAAQARRRLTPAERGPTRGQPPTITTKPPRTGGLRAALAPAQRGGDRCTRLFGDATRDPPTV